MERPATSRKGSASTYPCRSLSGSVQENGVEGVVLVVIQITGDPSAKWTAPPRSTHIHPDDVSHALIQQDGEVVDEFRQHDGVVTMMVM